MSAFSFGIGARRAQRSGRSDATAKRLETHLNASSDSAANGATSGPDAPLAASEVSGRTSQGAPLSQHPDEDKPSESRSGSTRAALKRALKIAVLLVLINFLGIPALIGVRNAVNRLADVQLGWLALGVGLQFAALLAYTQLMATGLPTRSVSISRLFRIQLATKSLTNVVPGGSAAGAALGYRLLTTSGVAGADAGFALAATGLISAVVLNLLFLIALLISIPLYGFRPAYVTGAIVGLLLIAFVISLGFAIVRGEAGAERILHRLTRRLKFVDADRIAAIIRQVAGRLREITQDRDLVKQAGIWAVMNWMLDAASLLVFIRAFGSIPYKSVVGLMIAFGLANIAAVIPITPGGLGVIEPTLTGVLTGFGIAAAAIPVSLYRLAQYWLPIPAGAIAYFTVRRGQPNLPERLRDVGIAAYADPASRFDWAEEFGYRNRANHPSASASSSSDNSMSGTAAEQSRIAHETDMPHNDQGPIRLSGVSTAHSLQQPSDTDPTATEAHEPNTPQIGPPPEPDVT